MLSGLPNHASSEVAHDNTFYEEAITRANREHRSQYRQSWQIASRDNKGKRKQASRPSETKRGPKRTPGKDESRPGMAERDPVRLRLWRRVRIIPATHKTNLPNRRRLRGLFWGV